jgi:hypothetical protein
LIKLDFTGGDMMSSSFQDYEKQMAQARSQFALTPGITTIISPSIDPILLKLFLISFCATGVRMTEPVEDWIRRAGERCELLGFKDLGKALKGHAKGESGHHLFLIEDLKMLISRWNAHNKPPLNPDVFLEMPSSLGVKRYCDLHERTISGNAPFGQLAIEYEIEMLSVQYGQRLINNWVECLGDDILDCLSFLKDHVELDVSHTKFNALELEKFISTYPTSISSLVEAGTGVLDAYAQFLDDCLNYAKQYSKEIYATK